MTAPTTMLWELAGRPDVDGAKGRMLKEHRGICCVSGEHAEVTADATKALGTSFTDRGMFRAPDSTRVGGPALWACSGKGTRTLRLWSIIAAPEGDLPDSHEKAFIQRPGLWLGNRSDTRPIIDTLTDPPNGQWLMSIAVSGQKHVAPYATVNRVGGRWTVRMESTNVTSTPEEWQDVHGHALALRRLGTRAEDVLTGTPPLMKTAEQYQAWHSHAESLANYHHSPLLELALWTITKPIMEEK